MKTFFIALILGIFIGSIVTNYFSSPAAWDELKVAKARLLGTQEEPTEVPPAAEPTTEESKALFEVGSGQIGSTEPENDRSKVEKPGALPKSKPLGEAPPTPDEPATNDDATLIEQGAKKAEEIADAVAKKSKQVATEAKPLLDKGIDLTIATAIRAKYQLERRIDSEPIAIDVTNQIVTLSGTVASEEAKQLAIEIAVFTKGVNGVEESLRVSE